MDCEKLTIGTELESNGLVKSKPLKSTDISRVQSGCMNYDLHQEIEESDSLQFHKNWENRELRQAYMSDQHLAGYIAATEGAVTNCTVHEMTQIA